MAKDHSPAGQIAEIFEASDERTAHDEVAIAADVLNIEFSPEDADALAAKMKAAKIVSAKGRAEFLCSELADLAEAAAAAMPGPGPTADELHTRRI